MNRKTKERKETNIVSRREKKYNRRPIFFNYINYIQDSTSEKLCAGPNHDMEKGAQRKCRFGFKDFHLDDSKSLDAICPAGHLTQQNANAEVYRAWCGKAIDLR